MLLSFIIPVFNEAENLDGLKYEINRLQKDGHEVIVVDGGSTDGALDTLKDVCRAVISSNKGRGVQMNAGAKFASGDVLVFLHADTSLPEDAAKLIKKAMQLHSWGRFDVSLTGEAFIFRVITILMNVRSSMTGIATGDQCIFISKALFERVGGFEEIPIMEDVSISKALRKIASPYCINEKVLTSNRRWTKKGIVRTIVLMWFLRLAYFLGVSPHKLLHLYYSE